MAQGRARELSPTGTADDSDPINDDIKKHSYQRLEGCRPALPRKSQVRGRAFAPADSGGAMAVFYLSVRIGDEVIRDREAYEFPTAQDARDLAVHAVHELIALSPDDVELEHRQIEIADATGHAISVVDLSEVAPYLRS